MRPRPLDLLKWKRNTIAAIEVGALYTPGSTPDTVRYANEQIRLLRESRNYFVTEDMTAICKAAGATLPANPPMHNELIPSPEGYLVYEVPIMDMVDPRDGEIVHIHGFQWHADYDRRVVLMYPLIQRFGHSEALPDHLTTSHSDVWWYGKGEPLPATREFVGNDDKTVWGIYDQPPAPLMYATWVVMSETIAAKDVQRGDRAEQKRCNRENTINEVVISRLRRAKQESSGVSEKREYSHRFMVDGHWKNVYYASDQSHRYRYIFPYVKGPADKELIIKDHITILER